MSAPLVSVCILTCNHEQYISDCIMSAVAQANDVPLEILVGDDCSEDGTSDIVRSLAQRFPDLIRHFRHETRQVGKNYQFLIGLSRGEYIAHLDGDDFWLPGKLIRQIRVLKSVPEVSACYTNALCVNQVDELLGFFNNRQPLLIDLIYLLRRGNFLNNSSVVYRAKYKNYFIERSPDYIDYAVHLFLARQGSLAYLNIFGTGYRVASTASLILNHGEFVRELYWRAICEVPEAELVGSSKLLAEADFLRRVFFRSVRIRDFGLINKWWRLVSSNREQKLRLFVMALISVTVVGSRELLAFIFRTVNKSSVREFYWR